MRKLRVPRPWVLAVLVMGTNIVSLTCRSASADSAALRLTVRPPLTSAEQKLVDRATKKGNEMILEVTGAIRAFPKIIVSISGNLHEGK